MPGDPPLLTNGWVCLRMGACTLAHVYPLGMPTHHMYHTFFQCLTFLSLFFKKGDKTMQETNNSRKSNFQCHYFSSQLSSKDTWLCTVCLTHRVLASQFLHDLFNMGDPGQWFVVDGMNGGQQKWRSHENPDTFSASTKTTGAIVKAVLVGDG